MILEPDGAADAGKGHDLPTVADVPAAALADVDFPCRQCGAVLHFGIGSGSLVCNHCGHRNAIAHGSGSIEEFDLSAALATLASAPMAPLAEPRVACRNCAAEFMLAAREHAGVCPFCGTTVVLETQASRPIKPGAVLPFAVTRAEAETAFHRWLGSLWFAPSALAVQARHVGMRGVYVPYWTYDSDTATRYAGQRGDTYHVTERYSTIENGRRVRRSRQVPKIRWRRVAGHTRRHFDDVLIGATRSLPRTITDWLQPWDLDALVPYTEAYLSGFGSEVYQVDLPEGFTLARGVMDGIIRSDVRAAIGGDHQRIHELHTTHRGSTFKLVLLPLWIAGFRHREQSYRFVVNGRTAKVRGERPYSRVKITLAVLAALLAAAVILLVMSASGALDAMTSGTYTY